MTDLHPAVQDAQELLQLEELHRAYPNLSRLERAVNLALTLEACEALLRDETVPLSKLDPSYFRRYGIRRTA